MLETWASMTFHDIFKGKWNGARVTSQKCPWKPIYKKYGY